MTEACWRKMAARVVLEVSAVLAAKEIVRQACRRGENVVITSLPLVP
jgi:hypothetical protein